MAALRAEEVGPMASTAADEALLAPEEVSKHLKGELKASDERTQTDRLRERRKKKKKQQWGYFYTHNFLTPDFLATWPKNRRKAN